ncbi:MAG: glutamyl-tRNA amidotransferase [Coxiella sp. RIFCSPHIGHO2_12_FULL_42_15]|nr:MAG: glutamyl-tRNA amidotransferase [Coxiella sp. RIFCSPHIGHO2_12_FULL_42_15]
MTHEGLKERIKSAMIEAMKAKDKDRLSVIRMLQAAIKQKEVDERVILDDPAIITVIEKMIKQRRESAKQYEEGRRPELAAKEIQEIGLLETYMPKALSEPELDALIKKVIAELQASSIKDMGKVMNTLKGQIQGRANMAEVSNKIKQLLS